MTKFFTFFVIIILLICCQLNAQDKRGYSVVYGGGGVFAKFDGSNSKPITGQLFSTPANLSEYVYIDGAHSCISDSTNGNLLFFSNSVIIYDTLGHIMDNGDSLQPAKIYAHNCCPSQGFGITQGSLIIPKGSNNQYYVFTPTITDSMYTYWNTNPIGDGRFPYNLLQYHVVDMYENAGMGKVVQKNVKILENVELCKTGMISCRHANGYDWWLLKQGANTNTIYTFLVTKDTVVLDTIQSFSEPIFGYYDLAGQSCFNSDGSKYAFATGGVSSNGAKLFMADFDRCHGVLSNVKVIEVPLHITNSYLDTLYPGEKDTIIRGLCFSPNDSFLFVSKSYNIYQYDLFEPDSLLAMYHVKQGPDTTFLQFAEYGQLHLGVDGRIYVGKRGGIGNSNSVINKPNLKGIGCDFCRKCLRMDTTQWYTKSFANMPNFNMPKKEPCWPLHNQQVNGEHKIWDFYPNPAQQQIVIIHAQNKLKILYNMVGQAVVSTTNDIIELRAVQRGVYYLFCEGVVKKVIIE
jgi:hypothetical protein